MMTFAEDFAVLENPAFLHPNEVRDLLQVSEPTLWRMRQKQGFPDPVPLTRRKVVYRRAEVATWLNKHLGLDESVMA